MSWNLAWFDEKTDALICQVELTGDHMYGEWPIVVPEGQVCFIGYTTDEVKDDRRNLRVGP